VIYHASKALTVKLREGRFSIIDSMRSDFHHIYHRCQPGDVYLSRVVATEYTEGVVWACRECEKAPPEGLLGVYLLLEMDDTQDQINNALFNTDLPPFRGV
jgi:hypothetical protein